MTDQNQLNATKTATNQNQDMPKQIEVALPFTENIDKALVDFYEHSETMIDQASTIFKVLDGKIPEEHINDLVTASLMLDAPQDFNMAENFGEKVAQLHSDLHYFRGFSKTPPSNLESPKLSKLAAIGSMAIALTDANLFLDYYEQTDTFLETAAPEGSASTFKGLTTFEKYQKYGYHDDDLSQNIHAEDTDDYAEIFDNELNDDLFHDPAYVVGILLDNMVNIAQNETEKCPAFLKREFSKAFNRASFATNDARSITLNERNNKFIIQQPAISRKSKAAMQ